MTWLPWYRVRYYIWNSLWLSITAFVFTFTVTLATLARIDTTVPAMTTEFATYSCVASLGLFLHMIDHLGKVLRPSGALRSIAKLGKDVIEDVYPRRLGDMVVQPPTPASRPLPAGASPHVVANPRDGVLLAFDHDGLASLAQSAGCTIDVVPQFGDFVATGDPPPNWETAANGRR